MVRRPLPQPGTIERCCLLCLCRSCPPTTRSGMHLFESFSPHKAHTVLTLLPLFWPLAYAFQELPTDDPHYEARKEREAEQEEERRGAANAVRGGEYMYI